jgi:hypothetical protein
MLARNLACKKASKLAREQASHRAPGGCVGLNASKQANNLPSKINQKTKIQSSRRQEGKTSSKLPNKQTMKPGAIKATKAQTNHGNKAATKRKVILSTKHRKASKQASRQASQQASRQACNEMSKQVRASQPAKQASKQASKRASIRASKLA